MLVSLARKTRIIFSGTILILVLSIVSVALSMIPILHEFHISSLTIAILVGMLAGNTVYHKFPKAWFHGIDFSQKKLLRWGIIFYGFRITFQQIADTGWQALLFDVFVVCSILIIGYYIGTRFLRLNPNTSLLVSSGSAICGAAAVLAMEASIKPKPHEVSIAIATVVLFGTVAMFLFPFIVTHIGLNSHQEMGVALGSTIHEVAQVVAAGNMVDPEVEATAVIVKLTRVMMLVPMLIIVGIVVARRKSHSSHHKSSFSKVFPWFAIGFIVMSGINSLPILRPEAISFINTVDNFLLTMAMAALGIESNIKKMSSLGIAPFLLAGVLFAILILFLFLPKYFYLS